ncbi:response regulator transcription factor [Asticcacaulis sp. 201]|uniref:response regulator transcription factor n=1 Tax=Asticcacaulis sp. 201 TaxID=3028787 RepID=UPI002916593E|nr:response regulator transcription factor [Asticcacaulis sp. 201]MDV6331158.1 response regulator transcription factor [Asticcacaulis sp. 201]
MAEHVVSQMPANLIETSFMPSRDTPAHLLIVDDDAEIRSLVVSQLSREGYILFEAGDLATIRHHLNSAPIDLIVLDLTLPDGDGLVLCRELRAEGHHGAIIMVTARDSAIDRVLGLELGADDYLTKPFEPRELTARIRNLLRRTLPVSHHSARFAYFGEWTLDLTKRRLIAGDNSVVMLSTTEYEILDRLVHNARKPLSREALLPQRSATVAFDRTIDNQISRLRQKLQPDGEDLILTVRSQGYLLASDVDFK